MKNIALSLAGLALVLGTPAVSLAQEAAPATQASATAQDTAVRSYMLKTIACMLESTAAQMESIRPTDQDPVNASIIPFINSFESAHKATAAIPTDGLPADFQAYINESDTISADFVSQARAVLPESTDALTEEDIREIATEVQALQLETQVRLEQLEEKYPAVAAVIGKEALKDFTEKVSDELQLREAAAEWAEAHKDELEAAGPAGMSQALRYMASLLREAADAK